MIRCFHINIRPSYFLCWKTINKRNLYFFIFLCQINFHLSVIFIWTSYVRKEPTVNDHQPLTKEICTVNAKSHTILYIYLYNGSFFFIFSATVDLVQLHTVILWHSYEPAPIPLHVTLSIWLILSSSQLSLAWTM